MTEKKLIIHEYHGAVADSAECVEWKGKFLQLLVHGRELLLFAPSELHAYHNQILGRYLVETGVPHRWIEQDILKYDFPALKVIGGGRYRLNTRHRTLKLWDNSQAYGRFDPVGLAEKIAGADHRWSGFSVDIR